MAEFLPGRKFLHFVLWVKILQLPAIKLCCKGHSADCRQNPELVAVYPCRPPLILLCASYMSQQALLIITLDSADFFVKKVALVQRTSLTQFYIYLILWRKGFMTFLYFSPSKYS